MISLDTARELLDFRGPTGALSPAAAEEQLKGAVALHNILKRKKVAYLADEVGMGKTYVALGAVALFRHFNPSLRLLVIAPRQNIQKKWVKELRNFVRNNVRVTDLRVKAVHGAPARPIVSCANLAELVRETALNPDRDFFMRLSSFSLPLSDNVELLKRRRQDLLDHLPWASAADFPLTRGGKAQFKDAYGRALCAALPEFDLVIVDEGHNLKHGFGENVSARNRVLGLAFGHPDASGPSPRGYAGRAKRVLFLSATPLEADYQQLWNQLDVFGLGDAAPELGPNGKDLTDEQKRACAQEFLIRRLTAIPVAQQRLTKNLYRREWRGGGVASHDHPLEITGPDRDRQRLVVALVQKKVSEILRDAKFNNSFQIGMLASFESFLQTAKVAKKDEGDEAGNFDGDQTDDPDERLGADVGQVNRLAASYRRLFEAELPHPKMDALVDHLAQGLPAGRKALVFVRRVASVKELQAKLEERYDEWLFARLGRELPELASSFEPAFERYRDERSQRRTLTSAPAVVAAPTEDDEASVAPAAAKDAEASSLESFFAWFFRGDGPEGFLSGAALKKRFERPGSAYSTFFEDNYAAWLLDTRPGGVFEGLAAHLGRTRDDVGADLRGRANPLLPPSRTGRARRLHLFVAMQKAALELLADHDGPIREQARVALRELPLLTPRRGGAGSLPEDAEGWLETPTLFTELRQRPELRASLWPPPKAGSDFRSALREQELRRYLLSGQARLGHAFIDLYVLALKLIGTLRPRARDDDSGTEGLIDRYLDLLERQRAGGDGSFGAFHELSQAAQHFDLIIDVNRPELRSMPLGEAARDIGRLLGSQQPVGGMFGSLNETLVRQFRLPGYPFVLFTTDLLQEGEDLHTFCSEVYHYGISWMPSSMEQRVGRIDRVNSHTERRLTKLEATPEGAHKLQVYYPHLRETVEVLQVRRVLKRMNKFVRLMHRDLRQPDEGDQRVNVAQAMLEPEWDIRPITEVLETAFPVRDELLRGPKRSLAVPEERQKELLERFHRLQTLQPVGLPIEWEVQQPSDDMLLGTARLMDGRRQPFSLILRSLEGRLMVRCVSPVGCLEDGFEARVCERTRTRPVQVGVVWNLESYNANVEGEVLLGPPSADAGRIEGLIGRVVSAADDLERELLSGTDAPLAEFAKDIPQESPDAD